MRKFLLAIILIAVCKIGLCQTAADFDHGTFTMFPNYKEDPEYFANINPDSTYLYWRCMYDPYLGKHTIAFEKGDKKYAKLVKKFKSNSGFMVGCPPGFCKYYIIAVKPDKSVLLINNSQKFKAFLGKVDNLDEVRLLVRDNRYTIHNNSMKSGSYQEHTNYYLLYLGDWISDMMVNYKTSTRAVLTKTGEFKVIDSSTYN
jgi:hypothetical protein